MRDRDVRQSVWERLELLHDGDADTLLLNELGVWQGAVRVDIAVINGEMHGYELKSASDNLERLHFQAAVYSSVFDRMTLVVAERHAKKASELVPGWWGLLVAKQYSKNDKVLLEEVRPSAVNECIDKFRLALLLWRDEVLAVLSENGITEGVRSKTRAALCELLSQVSDKDDLRQSVRQRIKLRQDWKPAPQQIQYDG